MELPPAASPPRAPRADGLALRLSRPEVLAVASGVLLALSFPKLGHRFVAWVALLPLLMALMQARSPGHGFRLGYLTGAISSLGIVYWTSLVVVQYGGLSHPVGIAVMVLLCLALAIFPSVFGALMALWARAWGPAALLMAPVAWVTIEMMRTYTLFNFSWCLLGYSQAGNLALIQVARYTAVYGVSFLIVLVSAVFVYTAFERRASRRWTASLLTTTLMAVVWMHGEWRLARPVPESGRIQVGLVQASILQEDKWDPGQAWQNVGRHFALTQEAARRGARLVVWPESALPFLFD